MAQGVLASSTTPGEPDTQQALEPVGRPRQPDRRRANRAAGRQPGRGVQPALHQEDEAAHELREHLHREKGDRKFWALRSASFTVRRGESIGVIGPNGAGKSTLLLVLAGIITPSEGQVEVDGHISTLLSLSAGFDQELSGYDNIALAGALMGIPHETVQQITPEVVEFADIGAFIDAPLKTYSSGMRARLGFAIATAVDPDILLLDEVLQTGDEVFREKSRQRIISILTAAKAVVLVTHDMTWVTEFCTRAILIEDGRVTLDGSPEEVVQTHREHSAARRAARREQIERMRRGEIAITASEARRMEEPERKGKRGTGK